MSHKLRASSLDSSASSASTTELEARKLTHKERLLELEDEEIEEVDNGMPSPKSVAVIVDEYVSASFVGRSSYASGDVFHAVTQFNEALGIELQTELDCLYDTNLGFVSGLVRREVQSRMQDSPGHSGNDNCKNILGQLSNVFTKASSESDRHPTKARWYLQMGAALCVVNEWEKAKQVYKEGIAMCKDKKELKTALKNLIKLEQITAVADIPAEDRPNQAQVQTKPPPSPKAQPSPAKSLPLSNGSPKIKRRRSTKIKFRRRSKSVSQESSKVRRYSMDSNERIPLDSVDTIITSPTNKDSLSSQRSGSIDSGFLSPISDSNHLKLTRVGSADVPSTPNREVQRKNSDSSDNSPLAMSDGMMQIRDRKEIKKINAVRNGKRNSFGAFLFGRHPTPTLSVDEKQQWTECFSPDGCAVTSNQSMTTSAIAHMRQLSVEPIKRQHRPSASTSSDDQRDGSEEAPGPRKITFEATPIKSLTIESDDSELDDD